MNIFLKLLSMAPATQKDDDILVVSEGTAQDDFDFHFDFSDIDTPKSEEAKVSPVQETSQVSQEAPSDLNFDFLVSENQVSSVPETAPEKTAPVDMKSAVSDFFSAGAKTEEVQNISSKPVKSQESSLAQDVQTAPSGEISSLGEVSSQSQASSFQEENVTVSETPLTSSNPSSESMNDILDATIAKLLARKESIGDEKSSKATEVEKIKAEIAELQAEKKNLEKEIATLESEAEKIEENKATLEKMKI